ncbi:tRNA (adenine(22)-N(1))-methyltransferase [Aureibacillus halotolerans]|uniref:tRNA (Adenine22-N1)-methyltransferase n=1 Tax=Aureibacillus halotolerans TaxID=1508390 RepID=A0A4R6U653_9BACI|nr:class I SAM-dependent methyltransferase [Aureibacillus halotolerans]TDQ41721.1 tRNA (adenine22-N1)-methyltransferase [Aureibacillus halotolerans]
MNDHTLSKRLETVASYIPLGARLADIGSDHAYLPVVLVQQDKIRSAIAGELNDGPFAAAKAQVSALHLDDKIDVRQGDGLSVLKKGEVDCITICGMGGVLIKTILEGESEVLPVPKMILQPNNGEPALRFWLQHNQYRIVSEEIIEENDKLYEVLIVEPGDQELSEEEVLFGPCLIKNPTNPVFQKKWQDEEGKTKRLLLSLDQSVNDSSIQEKREQFTNKLRMIQGVIQ